MFEAQTTRATMYLGNWSAQKSYSPGDVVKVPIVTFTDRLTDRICRAMGSIFRQPKRGHRLYVCVELSQDPPGQSDSFRKL